MTITISKIQSVSDLDFLFGKPSFNYTFDESTLDLLKKNFTTEDSLYLIAKQEEEFAGFCSIDKDWWKENHFFIREILVDDKFKDLGIGERLMKMCIEFAQNKKAIGVVTETDFKNFPMQNLCEKLEFKKWNNPKYKEGLTYKLTLPYKA